MKFNLFRPVLIGISCIAFVSCNTESTNRTDKENNNDSIVETIEKPDFRYSLVSPQNSEKFTIGDTLFIELGFEESKSDYDSAFVYVGTKGKLPIGDAPLEYYTGDEKTGSLSLRVVLYKDGFSYPKTVNVILRSDIAPKQLSYKIIKKYPHDVKAYTQGLIYEDGILYEGTGQVGESSLRKVKIETGELIQSYTLPQDVFGEGIVSIHDKIYQLTYVSKKVFVFDKETFKLLNMFNYQTQQGWGITNYKENLVMSDGVTNNLYILEPEFFTEIDRVEIYDDYGPIRNINELELVDGKIWANIWQTTNIVEIDVEKGKVLSILNLKDIVPEEYYGDTDNVLNGIAYNPENDHFYVTGKRWSTLYEIVIKR